MLSRRQKVCHRFVYYFLLQRNIFIYYCANIAYCFCPCFACMFYNIGWSVCPFCEAVVYIYQSENAGRDAFRRFRFDISRCYFIGIFFYDVILYDIKLCSFVIFCCKEIYLFIVVQILHTIFIYVLRLCFIT